MAAHPIRDEIASADRAGRPDDDLLKVLAALVRFPRGLASAEMGAGITGLSASAVGDQLRALEARGLARLVAVGALRSGRAVQERWWMPDWDAPGWDARLAALADVRLPRRAADTSSHRVVPLDLWHLFWNTDPASLDVVADAVLIAGRVLDAADPGADSWAVRALPADAWLAAARQRGRTDRQRAAAARFAALAR